MTFTLCSKPYTTLDEEAIPSNIVGMLSGLKSHLEYTDGAAVTKHWLL
jgi:hypothetical protein